MNTEQHRKTLSLRDDLAEALEEIIVPDARVSIDDPDPGLFYRDLSEDLITRGWVFAYPGEDGAA